MINIIPIGEEDNHDNNSIYGQHCDCIPSVIYDENGELAIVHNSLVHTKDLAQEELEEWYKKHMKQYHAELKMFGSESWIIQEWAAAYANEKISAGRLRDLIRELLYSKIKNDKQYKNFIKINS